MTIHAVAMGALNHEAPFLIEKLVKDRIVETPSEAEALFTEVKRFLILAQMDNTTKWQMYSRRVDECWHQFILFTSQYFEFCQRYFGRYIPHSPGNAPESTASDAARENSFAEFAHCYEKVFGMSPSDDWYDERHVTTNRRVLNDHAGTFALRNNYGTIELLSSDGEMLLSVNEIAGDALTFVVQTPAFYVRELPGQLMDDEKIGLVSTLVEYKLLRLAP